MEYLIFFVFALLLFFPVIFTSLYSLTKAIRYTCCNVNKRKAILWGVIFAVSTFLGMINIAYAVDGYEPLTNLIHVINQKIINSIAPMQYPLLNHDGDVVISAIIALNYLWIFTYGLIVSLRRIKNPSQDDKTKFSFNFWFIFLAFIIPGLLIMVSESSSDPEIRATWASILNYQTLIAATTAFIYAWIVNKVASTGYTLSVGCIAILITTILLKIYPSLPFLANLVFIGFNLILALSTLLFRKCFQTR